LAELFIAIDPGKEKCGIALMSYDGSVIEKHTIAKSEMTSMINVLTASNKNIERIAIGDGTGSREFIKMIEAETAMSKIVVVKERNTTLEARDIFAREKPLPKPFHFIPRWMLFPPADIDSYAAVAIGKRYVESVKEKTTDD